VTISLPDGLVALLRQASPCFISTSMPDGSPQLTQTWVDTDGTHILINTVDGFQKVKNIERDPRVAVAVSAFLVAFAHPALLHEVHRPAAGVVARAVLAPVLLVAGRHVEVQRRLGPRLHRQRHGDDRSRLRQGR